MGYEIELGYFSAAELIGESNSIRLLIERGGHQKVDVIVFGTLWCVMLPILVYPVQLRNF